MKTLVEPVTPYVSTGSLPPPEVIIALVEQAHDRYEGVTDGEPSTVYPALSHVMPDFFGISVAGTDGQVYETGDTDVEFTIMSVAKPFVFALVGDVLGFDAIREMVGANATGRPFNSVGAVEGSVDGRTNPMVNAGAIATTSLAPGDTLDERWAFLRRGLSRFAGRELVLNEEVYESASETNHINRSVAHLLQTMGRLYMRPIQATELYTRQCCLNLTARDLSLMGATLASGGVNPLTRERVVSRDACHYTLAVMLTAGLYENSGDWLYEIGLPGKSGIGGGIVTVSPGKGGLGTFAPRLDSAGNSVRGQLVARHLSRGLGFDLLLSREAA